MNPFEQSIDEIGRFRICLEQWFDSSMDRVSGWYRRSTQFFILILTVVIVFGVNVDTVAIANNLLQSQAVNQQLSKIPSDVPIGAMYAATPAPGTTEGEAQQISRQQALHFQQVVALLNSLNLPIGWPDRDFFDPTKTIDLDWWLKKWVGLGLTILAVWQSSGLWFDLISRFTDLRSSGPRPKRSSGVRDKA